MIRGVRPLKRIALVVFCAPWLAGCATMTTLTPQQERVYRDFETCQGRTATYQLERVNPDGSFTIAGRPHEREHIVSCLRERGHRMHGGY